MTRCAGKYVADDGCIFVLTQAGWERTLDHIKPSRAVGKPIKGYEEAVPHRWVEQGWVEERRINNE